MSTHARGTFTVTVTPQAADDTISDSRIGRRDICTSNSKATCKAAHVA